MNLPVSFVVGLRRRWFRALTHALSCLGLIWLITEITTFSSESVEHYLKLHGSAYLLVSIGAAATVLFVQVFERSSVTFQLPTTDTNISIRFGDLFHETDNLLIGVNEYFDSALGHVVAQHSVHGQFIINFYKSEEARFRADLDTALASAKSSPSRRPINPKLKYEIGTTAVLSIGGRKAFLVAMSHTDIQTSKASATVPMLWNAMTGALQTVRDYGNGEAIAMPLIGNGHSSVNIEPQHLLRLLVLAIVDFGRKKGLPKKISIIVPDACFKVLDIREIARDWRNS